MNEITNGNHHSGIVEYINKKIQEAYDRGEIVETPFAKFHFQYLSDPRLPETEPVFQALKVVQLPDIIIRETKAVMDDLRIKPPVNVRTRIPTPEDDAHINRFKGISGKCISETEYLYFIDPTNTHLIETIKTWEAKAVVHHEMNHIARRQAHRKGKTLLDGFISEGLAVYYERHWGGYIPKTEYRGELTEQQVKEEWQKAQQELFSKKYQYEEWFHGKNQIHPPSMGYIIGSEIIEQYMKKHPKIPMSKLVRMSSRKILSKSGFT